MMNTRILLPCLNHCNFHNLRILTLLFLLILIPQSQAASNDKWQKFNLQTVETYIVPGYQALRQEAGKLREATEVLCAKPASPKEALKSAQAAFHQTMDAWQHIQNIQFGPVQTLMRNYSLQFWPDKKNHVGKHLAQLISSQEPAALSEKEFHKASVSIKGLPAIERLLFDAEDSKALLTRDFDCQVLVRISAYTAQSAADIVDEWQTMKQHFVDTEAEDSYFEDDIDAATSILKTLVEPLEVIRDLKLLRPLGSGFGQQKASRLESWRSERSLRNLKINLDSLFQLYSGSASADTDRSGGLSAFLDANTDAEIRQQFRSIQQQMAEIPAPISAAIETEAGFKALSALADSLKTLHGLLDNAVAGLDIHLGFNSRDGD